MTNEKRAVQAAERLGKEVAEQGIDLTDKGRAILLDTAVKILCADRIAGAIDSLDVNDISSAINDLQRSLQGK